MTTILTQKKTKQSAKPVDRATPVIRRSKGTDVQKIAVTREISSKMKAAPLWSSSPVLQASVTAWNAAADAVENTTKTIVDLRTKLAAQVATQRVNRQSWRTTTKQVLADATTACAGSADQVHALGLDVYQHVAPSSQAAPTDLVTLPGKGAGEAVVSWQRGSARKGFMVQRAADPANPASTLAAVPCTKSKYTIENAPPGSVVHVRVAAIDPTSPTGQGPWSDWVACTVR
jgi:hypothetical protein